jgi:hypothetical protein
VSVVGLLFVLFFWPATLRGQFLILHDSWVWSYPLRSAAWRQLHEGRLPLWTTGIFSGYPLLSMSQLGLGYPLTWAYFFHGGWGEQVYVLAPFVLSPIFVYCYAREVRRTRSAALLAGLAYAYGGFNASPISHNGMLSNGFMWLPLMLVAIERSRRGPFIPCVVASSLAYAIAVLSGIGQAFLTVAMVAVAYGAFTFFLPGSPMPWRSFERARPALVAGLGVAFGAGVGAFQVLETVKANRLSVRRELDYATFSQGSASIERVLQSIFDPLHFQIGDVTSYVPPLALLLSIVAVGGCIRARKARDNLVFFWLGCAAVALLLMFGGSTPFYRIVHHVPLLNLFRVPPRHSAEWTLAFAILGAYGWDAVRERLIVARSHAWDRRRGVLAGGALLAGLLIAWHWNASETTKASYLFSKAALTIVSVAGVFAALALSQPFARKALCSAIIVLATAAEGYICISRWWFPHAKTAADLDRPSPTTEFLRRFPAHENRVYSHINGFGEEGLSRRPADTPNNTAWLGIHEVAGYDPMIFSRYSEALGNASMFGMSQGWTTPPDSGYGGPFNPRSRILDLLNATFVVRRLQKGEAVVPEDWEMSPILDRAVIDLGEPGARKALVRGWGGDEQIAGNTGSWTDGRESTIRVYILPKEGDYELRFSAIAFHPVSPLNVLLRVNGRNTAKLWVRKDRQEYTLRLKGKSFEDGPNDITFRYAKTMSPSELPGGSADNRRLAMFVDFFSLTPLD